MSEVWIASHVVLWILVLFLAFMLAGALRQIGLIQLRLGDDPGALITSAGLDRGTQAPDFETVHVRTRSPVRLSELPRLPRVLIFLSPECSTCATLIPHLNEVVATRGDEFDFLAICRAEVEACGQLASGGQGLRAPMVVSSGAVERDYQVSVTPFAYVLDYEGRVLVRGVVNTWRQLDLLLDQEGTIETERLSKQVLPES